jgi:hypothetical protein
MNDSPMDRGILNWLLDGDPAIRWQVMRDLLDEPESVWQAERKRVQTEGWGKRLLERQDPAGTWGSGLYSPKWISTTYTLLLLRQMGLPGENEAARQGCTHFWKFGLYSDGGINLFRSIRYSETCVNGMLLTLLCYFGDPDERIHSVADFLLRDQMPDGGWNCERVHGATHASFHTTASVMDGLEEYRLAYPQYAAPVTVAIQRGCEFVLQHRMYQSHRSGKPADPAMTRMYFPPRWRYDFIRGLDLFRALGAGWDDRMGDAFGLLEQKRLADGRWPAYRPWSGRVFFELEQTGQPSRWNTLRGLRVLRWRERAADY